MSQRSANNARTNTAHKGSSRKGAGSAKPKSSAASSVRVVSADQKKKQREQEAKQKQKQMQNAAHENKVLSKAEKALVTYSKYRRIWLVCIIAAIIFVGISWCASFFMVEGRAMEALASVKNPIQFISMILGYVAIIAALVIDFKFIRPIRKAQSMVTRKESKKQKQHREAEAAARAEKRASRSIRGKKK